MADPPVLVLGVGNDLRGDDAAGPEVVRLLVARAATTGVEVREAQGETTALLSAWADRDAVVIVDSARSGDPPGSTRRLDASTQPLSPTTRTSSSTHAIDVQEAIELARALGTLPGRIIVYTVEGANFDAGSGLSAPVREALPDLAEQVLREAISLAVPMIEGREAG